MVEIAIQLEMFPCSDVQVIPYKLLRKTILLDLGFVWVEVSHKVKSGKQFQLGMRV